MRLPTARRTTFERDTPTSRGAALLRNRLVHVYDEIDDVRVHQALATGLPNR